MDLKLRGKRALVTGSSRGIGRAIAMSLADFKVDVAINYLRNRTRAEETAHEIERRGVRALVVKGNVAKPDHVDRIFGTIEREWGGLEILVSNAASGVLKPAKELTMHHFDWAMHINAAALLPLIQNFSRMESSAEKALVAVSSLGAIRAIPNYTAVGASKAALESMVRHLAAEFAPEGIRVNAVSAGTVDTDAPDPLPEPGGAARGSASAHTGGAIAQSSGRRQHGGLPVHRVRLDDPRPDAGGGRRILDSGVGRGEG
jgi:enoyl-[acyl-carrier protein] reductase III